MREIRIQGIERRLNSGGFDRAGNERSETAAAITDDHTLLPCRKAPCDFLFDGFGRDVMAGIQDNQVLDAAADAPIAASVDLALVASVEPSILQHSGRLFRAVPVAQENVWAAHDDFFIFAELHLDSANRRADVTRLDGQARIIQRANAGGFREPVGLQHGNAEHQKKLLRLWSERRRTADQRAQVRAKSLVNLSKDEGAAEGEPKGIKRAATPDVLPLPGGAGSCK